MSKYSALVQYFTKTALLGLDPIDTNQFRAVVLMFLVYHQLRHDHRAAGDEVVIASSKGRFEIVALDPDFDAMCAAADNFIADHPNALKKLGE